MAFGHRMFNKLPSRTNTFKVPEARDSLEALIERGWTVQVISEVLGTYRQTVSKWRHSGAGRRDRMIALALDNHYFKRKPPKQKRYGSKPQ